METFLTLACTFRTVEEILSEFVPVSLTTLWQQGGKVTISREGLALPH